MKKNNENQDEEGPYPHTKSQQKGTGNHPIPIQREMRRKTLTYVIEMTVIHILPKKFEVETAKYRNLHYLVCYIIFQAYVRICT